MVEMDGSHPRLELDVEYPQQLSRGLIFVKWLLAFPHYIALAFLGIGVAIVTFIAFFAILFTGKYPESMWRFVIGTLRWQERVNAYTGLLRDEYPPFAFDDPYPANLALAYPTNMSRMLIFIKWLLIIPHMLALYIVGIAAQIVSLIAFFAILFTGKYPEGMFRFYVGFMRWTNRANAYVLLLTDDYPPFSLDSDAPGYAGGATAPAVSYN
jgi:hypothetical protein